MLQCSIFILQGLYAVLDHCVITVNSAKGAQACRLIWLEQKTWSNPVIALGTIPLDGKDKSVVFHFSVRYEVAVTVGK